MKIILMVFLKKKLIQANESFLNQKWHIHVTLDPHWGFFQKIFRMRGMKRCMEVTWIDFLKKLVWANRSFWTWKWCYLIIWNYPNSFLKFCTVNGAKRYMKTNYSFFGKLGHFMYENGASWQFLYDCNFLVYAKICISLFLILFQTFFYFYHISLYTSFFSHKTREFVVTLYFLLLLLWW